MADVLVFDTESDAISCLENMKRFLKTFGRISIDILYTMTGSLGFEDPPYNVGWTDLSKAYIIQHIIQREPNDSHTYYQIIWPPVKLIESTEDLKWAFKEEVEWLGIFKKGTTLI
jgi:hypothetical protein